MLFFKRYWRGEVSLPISYWLISWAVNISALGLIATFSALMSKKESYAPFVSFFAYLFLISVITIILVWQFVGLLRSAGNYINTPNKTKVWGYLAALGAVAGILNNFASYKRDVAPVTVELYRIAFLSDPDIPPYKITIVENGQELKIEGGIKYGLLNDVSKALALAPSVRTINLESLGGRIGVAEDLYKLLSPLNLNTVTNRQCLSACAYVFAAGKNRWLGIEGRLGFHSASFANFSQDQANKESVDLEMKIHMEKGIPLSFFRKASKVPAKEMWFPSRRELLKNKVITSEVAGALSSRKIIERELSVEIGKLAKTLPKQLDPHTTLIDVSVKLDRTTSIHLISESIARTLSTDAHQRENLKRVISKNLCQKTDVREAIRLGVIYHYVYLHPVSRVEVASFELKECH